VPVALGPPETTQLRVIVPSPAEGETVVMV
jgi:hypothetical protein